MKKILFALLVLVSTWLSSSAQYIHGDVPDSYEMWAEEDPFAFDFTRDLAWFVTNRFGVVNQKIDATSAAFSNEISFAESPKDWFVFTQIDDKTVELTGPSVLFPTNLTDVIAPSFVGGKKVTRLGDRAFGRYGTGAPPYSQTLNENTPIVSFHSETIRFAGQEAFNANQNVRYVSMPSCESTYGATFWACSNLTSVNLCSITNIGFADFRYSGVLDLSLPKARKFGNGALNDTVITNIYAPSLRDSWAVGYGPLSSYPPYADSTNRIQTFTLGANNMFWGNDRYTTNHFYPAIVYRFPRGSDWYKTKSFFSGRICQEYDPEPWELPYVGTIGLQNQINQRQTNNTDLVLTDGLWYDAATNVVWKKVISNGWEYLVAHTNYTAGGVQ